MKLLIICQYFHPDITAAAFRVSDAAELLAQSGDDVRVITAFPHRGQAPSGPAEKPPLPEAAVYRSAVHPLAKGGLTSHLRHYLSFVRGSLASAARLRRTGWRPDVIWASSPPLFTALTGRRASKLFRAPWVLDVRDLWPDSAVAAGQLRAHGLAFRLGKWLEASCYRRADHVTCVSAPMRRYLAQRTRNPVTLVYNGVKSADILPAPVPAPATAPGRRRVLLYAGNLGRLQGLDTLVRAVADLERDGGLREWEVRLVGAGVLRAELTALIGEQRLEARVRLQPPVARSHVAQELRRADALFVGLRSDPVLGLTIPSKLFDCLAANKPVLAAIAGEGAEIAGRSGGNVVCAPQDTPALRRALQTLVANYDDLAPRACRNGAIVRESFTREQAITVLADALRQTAQRRLV